MAMVAPMPSANVSTAAAANAGLLRSVRKPNRKFWTHASAHNVTGAGLRSFRFWPPTGPIKECFLKRSLILMREKEIVARDKGIRECGAVLHFFAKDQVIVSLPAANDAECPAFHQHLRRARTRIIVGGKH